MECENVWATIIYPTSYATFKILCFETFSNVRFYLCNDWNLPTLHFLFLITLQHCKSEILQDWFRLIKSGNVRTRGCNSANSNHWYFIIHFTTTPCENQQRTYVVLKMNDWLQRYCLNLFKIQRCVGKDFHAVWKSYLDQMLLFLESAIRKSHDFLTP